MPDDPTPSPAPTPTPTPDPAPPAPDPAPSAINEVETPAPAPEPLTIEALTVPEGMTLDAEVSTEFLGILNNAELDGKSRAQALLDLQSKVMTQTGEALHSQWRDVQTKWQDEIKADPELGGAKMSENLGEISKLLTSMSMDKEGKHDPKAEEALRAAFDQTGAGNNPAVVRFLFRVAKQLNEGKPAPVPTPAPGGRGAATLYPTMNK